MARQISLRYAKVPAYGIGGFLSGALSGASTGAAFGPVGAVAGGLLGGLFGSSSQDDEKKRLEAEKAEQERLRLEMERKIADERSRAILSSYPTNGIAGASYYGAYGMKLAIPKKGGGGGVYGKIKYAAGGEMVPLASDASLVQGDTHEQDSNMDGQAGVTLSTPAGDPIAEVEDQEVIVGDKVFSTRLGFAPVAERLAAAKGAHEASLKSSDRIKSNTAKRNIEKIDMDINDLFTQQELVKGKLGLANPAGTAAYGEDFSSFGSRYLQGKKPARFGDAFMANPGYVEPTATPPVDQPNARVSGGFAKTMGTVGNVAQSLVPFVDNYVNSELTKNTPKVPVPTTDVIVPRKVGYNIRPQLNAAKRARINYSQDISSNVANSQSANALKARLYAENLNQENQLYGTKENVETNQFNEAAANAQFVTNRNLAKVDSYNQANMYRAGDIQQRQSENIQNLVGDVNANTLDQRNRELDDKKIALSTKANSLDNDAAAYQSATYLLDSYRRLGKEDELRDILSKSKSGKELWNTHFPNKPIQ